MIARISALCLLLMLVLAASVSARPYYGLGVMAVMLEDADLTGPATGQAEFDAGWGVLAFVGSKMELFRVEGELAHRRSSVDQVTLNSEALTGGRAEATSAMFNVYLDFGRYEFRPFIGAGAGAARVKTSLAGASDRETVFAYQGIAGVSLGAGLDLGYRYFATEDPRVAGVRSEYASHNLFLAVRF